VSTLFNWSLYFAQLSFALAMCFSALRIVLGPRAQDRVLALDTLYMNAMITLLMLGIRTSTTIYFDIALLIALFGFVGSIALAKFLLRGEVIEP
jgi:multicomponent K+:H+ antiporter subunit F